MEEKISQKYHLEIQAIENLLNKLEKGRIYELSHVGWDGALQTNIIKLRKEFYNLIYKIENNIQSNGEILAEAIKKYKL